MSTQTWIEIGAGGSSVLKDLAPIIAASITGLVTLGTAIIIARISHRQAETAANKLAVDLFEKRFENWKALERTLNDYVEDAKLRYLGRRDREINIKVNRAWVDAESDAHWLFGDKIFSQVRLVGDRLAKIADHDLDEDDEGEPWEREDRFERKIAVPAYTAFAELRSMIAPYMMLDKVAVNQPTMAKHALKI